MRLPSKIARIRIADDLFYSGDDILLANINITLGEESRSSSCEFSLLDPGLIIGGKYQKISFEQGGILVPPDLLQDPQPVSAPGSGMGAGVSPTSSPMPASAEESVKLIVAECQRQGITNPQQIAYILGTAQHESDQFNTLTEYDDGSAYEGRSDLGNNQPGDGTRYKGRGYVQLTGRVNYERYTEITGKDLVNQPELLEQDAGLAAFVLVDGMRNGAYTGAGLGDFTDASGNVNFVGARAIVNGSDRADLIAGYAQEWLGKLPQYLNNNLNMQPPAAAAPTQPSLAPAQPLQESSFKGTEIIVEIGFQSDKLIAFHFIHTGTSCSWGNQGHTTSFKGQSIRWLLTRVPQTRAFDNQSLRDVAATFTGAFGIKLDFNGDGTQYQHLDMTGCTPFELLMRECRQIGFRVADVGDRLIVEPAAQPQFTNLVIDERWIISANFNDQARAATSSPPGAPASAPEQGATPNPANIDRQSGQVSQTQPIDVSGTDAAASAGSGVVPGTATPPVTGTPQPQPVATTSSVPATPAIVSPGDRQVETRQEGDADVTVTRERGRITTVTTKTEGSATIETTKVETESGTTITTRTTRDGKTSETTRQTTAVNAEVFKTLNEFGTASPPTARDAFNLPKQESGSIDLADDGRAEPSALVDESQRVKGFESDCVLMMTDETLQIVPGQIIGFSGHLFVEPFNREWRVGSVQHDFGASTTSLSFYTPQAPPPNTTATSSSGTSAVLTGQVPSAGGWIYPCSGIMGDGYGPREGRPPGYMHRILDIANSEGTPIVAMNAGLVADVESGCSVGNFDCGGGWGNFVLLQHEGNIFTRYCHLSSVEVQKGQQVQRGQVVGRMGDTGHSYGSHLHLDVRSGNEMGEIVLCSTLGLQLPGGEVTGEKRAGFEY